MVMVIAFSRWISIVLFILVSKLTIHPIHSFCLDSLPSSSSSSSATTTTTRSLRSRQNNRRSLSDRRRKKNVDAILEIEKGICQDKGYDFVIGSDESGTGSLAGPIIASSLVIIKDIATYKAVGWSGRFEAAFEGRSTKIL